MTLVHPHGGGEGTARAPAPPPLSMNIGPTRLAAPVLARLAEQPEPLYTETFLRTFSSCLSRLRTVLGAPDATVLLIPGSGTNGLEAAAASLLAPGSAVLVVSTGQWGDRWADICAGLGLRVRVVRSAPGEGVPAEVLTASLRAHRPAAVLATQVDSSSGVRLDLARLAQTAHRYGALLMADSICAAGAEHIDQSAADIDVCVTSSPKALSAAAGLAAVSLLPQTVEALAARHWPARSYSLDLRTWLPVMQQLAKAEFAYFQTPASSLVTALDESLRLILDEGVTARVGRHRALRDLFHDGLADLNITVLAGDRELRANGVTVCRYPTGHGPELLDRIRDAGVLLPAGTHPVAGPQTFRTGHLGNVTEEDIHRTLAALRRALTHR